MPTATQPASRPQLRALAVLGLIASSVLACAGSAFAAPHDTTLVSRASLPSARRRQGRALPARQALQHASEQQQWYFVDGLVAEVTRSPMCERNGG